MKGVRKAVILFALIVIFGFGLFYFWPRTQQASRIEITSSLEGMKNISSGAGYLINGTELESGSVLDLKIDDVVRFNIKDADYYMEVIDVHDSEVVLGIMPTNGAFFIEVGKDKKIELNDDGSYEVLLKVESISNGEAKILIKSITEKISVTDSVGLNSDSLLQSIQSLNKTNLILIFVTILLLFLAILAYFLLLYVLPAFRIRKMKERENPVDALKVLVGELKGAGKGKEALLRKKINHLYGYLSSEEKKEARKQINGMERYIN